MLDDLRRIIESEMEYDDLNDIMMEATDNSIAAMFIEEDGEAVISDSEVMSILEKIPDYDEEAAMNKKLARIAEAYIPEELEYEEVTSESWDDYEEDYEDDFLYEAFGLEKLKKKKVDIEVIYDDKILYVHAYTAGSDYNDSDLVDQYQVDTPKELQVDHSREQEDMPEGEFDKQIFAAVRKAIKKPLAKKGFKIAKMFMH